jgi:signal transduction histidine kinase
MDLEIFKQFNFLKKSKSDVANSSETTSNETVSEDHSEYPDHSEFLEIKRQNERMRNQVKQLKAKLYRTRYNNAKFIALIAHDLRSPFNTITGFLQLLKEEMGPDEGKKGDYIQYASESAEKTLNLIDSLQNWALNQNNEQYFNPVKINLSELFAELIGSIDFLAKPKQIKISDYADPELVIFADYLMIKTILRNLIDNAIKFTDRGSTISLSGSDCGQEVEIEVKDAGKGMSGETQKNLIKDPFHSKNDSCNENGSCLGLFLCKEFVEEHGGTMQVESEPGKGSKFKFTLPNKYNFD